MERSAMHRPRATTASGNPTPLPGPVHCASLHAPYVNTTSRANAAAFHAVEPIARIVIKRMLRKRRHFLEAARRPGQVSDSFISPAELVHRVGARPRTLAELQETLHRVGRLVFQIKVAEQP